MEELWITLREFPDYAASNQGRIARVHDEELMSLSSTREGDVKISLWDASGVRKTRSVKVLVAQEFVFKPRDTFDSVIVMDNDKSNLYSSNLAWRPYWFAWKYVRQFKDQYPEHYYTIPVVNMNTQIQYRSIFEAAMANGCLAKDVFRSIYAGERIFPDWHVYATP